ncbi:OLC1v1019206C2 [Oldenlandia corymbosa var. corymbosa]|uniref:OLC1v1019206C2 n=1 Tax=Oldenlandia corymbosa var. corymbosa TaxID=529605 RepID=A0AAV1EDC7_OLDCO|nr:OLC1v1019206C2 [Oldenlandia corymbosa var. corymbosa]
MSKKNQEEDELPSEFNIDFLFERTMRQNWKVVLKVYQKHPYDAAKAKLTKSEETALHIAVSSYRKDQPNAKKLEGIVDQLLEIIRREHVGDEVLMLKNDKGNTPLHLAAALGSERMCRCIVGHDKELINNRNLKGETPLFLAAHHGKKDTFICLHKLYNDIGGTESDDSLCRRKDGDTILHSAISGEFFELAYQIITYYPKLVNSVNQEGFSPLHFLARKPNVFESSSNLRLFDRFIYRCAVVHELDKHKFSHKNSPCCRDGTNHPENYQTCINFFTLPWDAFRVVGCSTGGLRTDEENPKEKDQAHRGEVYKKKASFPPNYATGVLLFKLFINILLTMFGTGIWRIGKIKEKKERNKWAAEIMEKMIKLESDYKYDHNGGTPTRELEPMYAERFAPPSVPPPVPDSHSTIENHNTEKKFKDKEQEHEIQQEMAVPDMAGKKHGTIPGTKKVTKETPLLLAAKMGITEMVKMILDIFPVAMQDLDANEKNVLLLAVENRQTEVYQLLLNMKLPEFVLYQVDDEGNSAIHLAAKFQKHQPWRIPGAALQMQWEIKWYKHVKRTMMPQCFIQYNKKGETANEIFRKTHVTLVKDGSEWLIKTSESCSLVAALIATVAFATSSTVPGGVDQNSGLPIFENQPAFLVFSIASVVALCFSVTALVFFLAILTSRCQQQDFRYDLPRKLLFGLSSLFTSIAAILISFCAGHFFLLQHQVESAAYPIYTAACLPITFYAFAQLPLYFDLIWSITRKVPLRSYKVFYL